MGIVGVQALYAGPGAAHSAGRPWSVSGAEQLISFGPIRLMRIVQSPAKTRIVLRPGLHPFHPPGALEPPDAGLEKRAGQPVDGWEGSPVVEDRRHLHHHGKPEMASKRHFGVGAQGSLDLGLDDLAVIS